MYIVLLKRYNLTGRFVTMYFLFVHTNNRPFDDSSFSTTDVWLPGQLILINRPSLFVTTRVVVKCRAGYMHAADTQWPTPSTYISRPTHTLIGANY